MCVSLNWVDDVLGPPTTDQVPEPTEGELAPSCVLLLTQAVLLAPALDAVGVPLTKMVTLEVDVGQGLLLILHVRTYVPAPLAGVNVAPGLVVLLNCEVEVLGPLATLHDPEPTDGEFAASTALLVWQIVWLLPAFETVGFRFNCKVMVLVDEQVGPVEIVH